MPDWPTPINPCQPQSTTTLAGGGTVSDHLLWVDAEDYTLTDAALIPLGDPPGGGDAPRLPRVAEIGDAPLDQNLVLRPGRYAGASAARAECPRTGATLELWTAEPGGCSCSTPPR